MIYLHTTVCKDREDYGDALNKFMEKLDKGEWLLHVDADAMFTTKNWYEQVHSVIDKPALITGVTNRINPKNQRVSGISTKEHNMKYHFRVGRSLYKKYGSQLKEWTDDTEKMSGFFFMIPKEIWKDVGPFPSGFLGVDNRIHELAEKKYPVYIMPGLYLYHAYKLEEEI